MNLLIPAIGLALRAGTLAAAAPAGIDPSGQMQVLPASAQSGFDFTLLESGVQVRTNGFCENVLFHGPDTVRVNTNLGRVHTRQPSLVVTGKPASVPFEVKDSSTALTLVSAQLQVRADKKTGALAFLRPDGSEITRESLEESPEIKELTIAEAPTYAVKQTFTLSPDARWNQFGIFNPVYRIHGTSIEREPYLFKSLDPEVYKSLLDAANLRYRLLPYLYALGWQTTANGYTMMRGLAMDFPDDQKVRKLDDAFTFGPAFLVHPVTRAMYRVGTPPPADRARRGIPDA